MRLFGQQRSIISIGPLLIMYGYIIKHDQPRKKAYNVHTGIVDYGGMKRIKKVKVQVFEPNKCVLL